MKKSQTRQFSRVSVIMPVYNAQKYLKPAIESVLQQTFTEFELVIVDDGSVDNSWEIIRSYARKSRRIVALQNTDNLKISKTLNRCLTAAQGEYVARMDADDIAAKERLAIQVAYMDAHPEVGISGGTMKLINDAGNIIGRRKYHLDDRAIRRHIFRYSPFSHPVIIMRKSVLDECGYYNPEYDFAEDYELYFRIGLKAKFGNVHDVLLYYRVLPKSITATLTKTMELKTLAIRKKAVQDYGYNMTIMDRIYWILQYISVYIIPCQIKIWVFNKISSWRG